MIPAANSTNPAINRLLHNYKHAKNAAENESEINIDQASQNLVRTLRRIASKQERQNAENLFERRFKKVKPTKKIPASVRFPCGHPKTEENYTERFRCKTCDHRSEKERNRSKFIAISSARMQGDSWDVIAEDFGYKNAKTAQNAFRNWAEKYAVTETIAEIRQIHSSRLEHMYQQLIPGIEAQDKGTPRAVEVAIKVLERQAHLHGADAVEEVQTHKENTQQQAVVINITAHPGDEQAKALIIEGRSSEVGRGQGISQVLPPSNPGLSEPEKDNLFGGGDIRGEDLVRALLDSQTLRETPE